MAEHTTLPLAGKRVVVTRAERQSAELIAALSRCGANTISLPLIRTLPPLDSAPLDRALHNLWEFDWLIFTSQNAVAAVADRLAKLKMALDPRANSPKIAAVSRATAQAATGFGFAVSHVGAGGTAANLVRELERELAGKQVLLPRSDRAAAGLVAQLVALKAEVADVIAYRTSMLESVNPAEAQEVAKADALLFFSPSAVRAFLGLVTSGVLSSLREDAAMGAIGPVTASALRDTGMKCDFQALRPTADEIVTALAVYFKARKVSASGAIS